MRILSLVMKTARSSRWSDSRHGSVVGGLLFLFLVSLLPAEAQTNTSPGILFLHLKVKNRMASLVETNLRPGVLKPAPEGDATALFCELVSEAGTPLWKGSIADPTVRHLEYEDPANPGQLLHKIVQVDEAEFTLRVPALPEARRIDFFKLRLGSSAAAGSQNFSRTSWGSITLPANPPATR
jgi:hypothetical protein